MQVHVRIYGIRLAPDPRGPHISPRPLTHNGLLVTEHSMDISEIFLFLISEILVDVK